MPKIGATPFFALPDFQRATRRLVLANLCAYFILLLAHMVFPDAATWMSRHLVFVPYPFVHGALWQPFTYSLMHAGLRGTLFELLSLWFLAGFLENYHNSGWVTSLYAVSVLGTALAATLFYLLSAMLGHTVEIQLAGCMGGIFGLLVAIGVLYGDVQFLVFFVFGVKARYMVAIYAVISLAMLFGKHWMYAVAQLGGALTGLLYIRLAPRRSIGFRISESWYSMRNRYYRWKRRRAARKFEVYMRSQGRTVRFDGHGRQLDDDPSDKKRWN